ncbi:MAG TPA: alpha/beta hydrolase [Acidimicrobiales bacterium]
MSAAARPVDVPLADGRRLEATVRGDGPATVVFEAGLGSGQTVWALVAPVVAERARVVTYNRSGFGRSTPDAAPRTLARLAADLLAVLDHVGAERAVLAGHSWGGPIVREALAAAPERVAALVLVDQTDEGCDLFFAPATVRQQRLFAAALPALARVGLLRSMARSLARPLPAGLRRTVGEESGTLAAARAQRAELAACDPELRRLRDAPAPPPEVPVTVISGTRRPRRASAARRRDCLVAAHERRAAAAPRGRHVRAERSEHMVMLTEPSLVADEVLRLLG